MINRCIYLKTFRSSVYQIRMYMKQNQKKCVLEAEKLNQNAVFFAFEASDKISTITIEKEKIEKLSSNKKKCDVVIINHCFNIDVAFLFVVAAKPPKKKKIEKTKYVMSKMLDKQIEKKNLEIKKHYISKNKNLLLLRMFQKKKKNWNVENAQNTVWNNEKTLIVSISNIVLMKSTKKKTLDSIVLLKIRKSKMLSKFKTVNFWKTIADD